MPIVEYLRDASVAIGRRFFAFRTGMKREIISLIRPLASCHHTHTHLLYYSFDGMMAEPLGVGS